MHNTIRILFLSLFCFFSLSAAARHEQVECQVYFSPEDHLAEQLIALIAKERKSALVAVYCFTHQGISKALIQAKKRGVRVEVIVDPYSLSAGKSIKKMAALGIPVFLWDPPVQQGQKRPPLMHDKFCVLGDEVVWTGSFNFTYQATTSHQENAVVLHSKEIADAFSHQFEVMKQKGCRKL